MINPSDDNQPIDVDEPFPTAFKECSFLVNVAGDMYDQWADPKKKCTPSEFLSRWNPTYSCKVPCDFRVSDYNFFGPKKIIFSTYIYEISEKEKVSITEPFGFIARRGSNYFLAYHGSKSVQDFLTDAETALVPYTAPTTTTVRTDMRIGRGWQTVHTGLLADLRTALQSIHGTPGQVRPLTITGHSLGSVLATLAVPEAVQHNFHVQHYNSASPKVGNQEFKHYYQSLRVIGPERAGWVETSRLVNFSDIVHDLPASLDYVHVGLPRIFDANYAPDHPLQDIAKNHDVCCCYAYAIYNQSSPFNPDFKNCHGQSQVDNASDPEAA